MDQGSIKYTNIFHCKTLQKFTQIWIFGLKTNHPATLPPILLKSFIRRFAINKLFFLMTSTSKMTTIMHFALHSGIVSTRGAMVICRVVVFLFKQERAFICSAVERAKLVESNL
jgi:hypothetical protein